MRQEIPLPCMHTVVKVAYVIILNRQTALYLIIFLLANGQRCIQRLVHKRSSKLETRKFIRLFFVLTYFHGEPQPSGP